MTEGDFFTVEQAAKILDCHRATVYRLLADGWLNGTPGGSKNSRSGRVTQKSLFQFMIIDRLSRLSIKALNELKNGRKHFGRFLSQTANANRFYNKGEDEMNPSPSPLPQERERNSQNQTRCLHHDFVEQHYRHFRRRARQLSPAVQRRLPERRQVSEDGPSRLRS